MKITLLNHQNDDGHSNMMSNAIKNFGILAVCTFLYNYFNDPLKLFLDLYLIFSYFSKIVLFA